MNILLFFYKKTKLAINFFLLYRMCFRIDAADCKNITISIKPVYLTSYLN